MLQHVTSNDGNAEDDCVPTGSPEASVDTSVLEFASTVPMAWRRRPDLYHPVDPARRAARLGDRPAVSMMGGGRAGANMDNPQAMLLVVPNGKVKLLNALPFAPADLRRVTPQVGLARTR
jgi:hypothetical protein